jgi:hypothetical protein
MKPLLIAAVLLLAPAAARAQVAAGALPNTFDRPAQAAPVQPSTPTLTPAPTPANARSEEVLREIIASAQAGAIDYSLMTEDLGGKVREQAGEIQPLIQGFGPVQAVDFVGAQDGADLFVVLFANQATQWVIGFDGADKVAALLFRPAE